MVPGANGGWGGFQRAGRVVVLKAHELSCGGWSSTVAPPVGSHLLRLDAAGFDGCDPLDPQGAREGLAGAPPDPQGHVRFHGPDYQPHLSIASEGPGNAPDTHAAEGAHVYRQVKLPAGSVVSFHYRFGACGRSVQHNAFAALRFVQEDGQDLIEPIVLAQARQLDDAPGLGAWVAFSTPPLPFPLKGWLQWLVTSAQYVDGAGVMPTLQMAQRWPACLYLCGIEGA